MVHKFDCINNNFSCMLQCRMTVNIVSNVQGWTQKKPNCVKKSFYNFLTTQSPVSFEVLSSWLHLSWWFFHCWKYCLNLWCFLRPSVFFIVSHWLLQNVCLLYKKYIVWCGVRWVGWIRSSASLFLAKDVLPFRVVWPGILL